MNDFHDIVPNRKDTGWGARWVLYAFAVIISLGIISGAIGWLGGWMKEPARITSVDNVRAQWRFAYDYDESLSAIASQVCIAEKALAAATDPGEQTQRRSQLMAYEQNYARVAAEYNARLRNAFDAKWVKPSDVPSIAPTLGSMKQRSCTS